MLVVPLQGWTLQMKIIFSVVMAYISAWHCSGFVDLEHGVIFCT